MKVLYIIDTLEAYGAEKSLVEIALNFKNITPVFVHLYSGDFLRSELEEKQIKVYSLQITGKYAFEKCLKKLIPVYQKENPAIVHATLFRSEIVARKLKTKFPEFCLVGSFVSKNYAGLQFKGFTYFQKLKLLYFHLLNRYTINKVDFFISNSHVIKESTIKELNIPCEKVVVIHRGRDINKYFTHPSEIAEKQKKFMILNISRLIPSKGQMDLLEAIALIQREMANFKLIIAGEGNYRSELESMAKSLGIWDKVEFPGRVNDVAGLIKKADVFVFPSYSEGLSGALIEAMMARKIIIASNIPENLECVNSQSAIIFELGNIEQLAGNLLMVYNSGKDYLQKAETAQRIAKKKFSVENISEEYEKTYSYFLSKWKNNS